MADIVVGSGGGRWRTKKVPWRFIALVLAVLVVATGAGVGIRWWQQRGGSTAQTSVADAVSNAADYSSSGDYNKAHEAIDKALERSNLTSTEKYNLLIQQGATYLNQGDYDKALEAYRQAEAIDQTYTAAAGAGRAAEMDGDKATAISYYKKALARILGNDPLKEDTKQYFEGLISALEKGEAGNEQ